MRDWRSSICLVSSYSIALSTEFLANKKGGPRVGEFGVS